MQILVRNAIKADYEAVINILSQAQQMHVNWRPDIYKKNDRLITKETFEQIVANNNLLVAETNKTVVGILQISFRHIENTSHVTRDIVYVETLAVEETCRNKGIGHLLLDKAKEIKKEKKFDGIELQINAKNKTAYEFYQKYGFTDKSINMELL